jgi:nucleotide-binding universal stress UspA family protein
MERKMPRLGTILYATDLSPNAEPALRHAVSLARQHRAGLHMLHVFDLGDEPERSSGQQNQYLEGLEIRVRELTEEGMDRLIRWAGAEDLEVARARIRGSPVASKIVEYAHRIDADLIVMGTHGRRGIRRMLLGSVAADVLRASSCDILTVRPGREHPPTAGTHRILVPVDFSEGSQRAVGQAKFLAAGCRGEVQLLHVFDGISRLRASGNSPGGSPRTRPQVSSELQAIASELIGPEVKCSWHAKEGRIGQEIVGFAEHYESDLIVMAMDNVVARPGSPAGTVIHTVTCLAPCPVFTLKCS